MYWGHLFVDLKSYNHGGVHWHLICRLKEFIKEQIVNIPVAPRVPGSVPPAPPVVQPTSPVAALTDPGAMLAGLLWQSRDDWWVRNLFVIHVNLILYDLWRVSRKFKMWIQKSWRKGCRNQGWANLCGRLGVVDLHGLIEVSRFFLYNLCLCEIFLGFGVRVFPCYFFPDQFQWIGFCCTAFDNRM